MDISFELNGGKQQASVDPVKRLSEFLRSDLGCCSCTVLIDGEIACSCLTSAAQVDGTKVETLEGMGRDGTLTKLQKSFLHFGAAQCGICTPGMLISAKVLLESKPTPSKQEVEDALGGVLCRCTGYRKIVEAVMHANDFEDVSVSPEAGEGVGAPIRHLDGVPKVDGTLKYGNDTIPADALYVRVIRSPHHFAEFSIGDKQAFVSAHEGVEAFMDASDIPGSVARWRGEAVAAVVGDEATVRAFSDDDFPVSWQPQSHALLPHEAMNGNLKNLHEGREGN